MNGTLHNIYLKLLIIYYRQHINVNKIAFIYINIYIFKRNEFQFKTNKQTSNKIVFILCKIFNTVPKNAIEYSIFDRIKHF